MSRSRLTTCSIANCIQAESKAEVRHIQLLELEESGEREQGEVDPVVMVVEVEDLGEARASGQLFKPRPVSGLGLNQVFDAMHDARARRVAARHQSHQRPGGLGRRAFGWGIDVIVVTGAAFAPSAIGILNGTQPLVGALDVWLVIVLIHRAQAAQGETGTVDVSDAPAAIPASIRQLRPDQIVDGAVAGAVIAVESV